MHIAIVGAGGIGGYFGARFALRGHHVTFPARGAHLAAMRERGLTVARDQGLEVPVLRTVFAAPKPYVEGASSVH